MPETTLTAAMIEYLAGLWKLENREQAMTTSALASYLQVSDTAVSRMTKRLAAVSLVTHLPHRQIGLTAEGRQQGGRLVRHHRLLEVFLIQVFGFTWDQVDVEAHRLEHGISEVVGDRMEEILGFPTHCPHGDPIPTKDGRVEAVAGILREYQDDPEKVLHAPHTTPVRKLDEVAAARQPDLVFPLPEA